MKRPPMTYIPPIDDMDFLLRRVFDFDKEICALPGYEEVTAELAMSVLTEGGRFCAERLEPLNLLGDDVGCSLSDGSIVTPKGFSDAYRGFAKAGWPSLSGDPNFGGQGLPRVVQILLDEMLASANLSFGLFAGLTRGAAEAIAHHATGSLKALYLPRLVSGEWTGVMALTEAGAGTDLGLLSTKAEHTADGSYRITGTKIFISSGDHDFGGNVVHLVLARLPDAPKGVRGISLFLCPKFLPDADGTLGPRNGLYIGALEQKMGIHAQPTCVMHYDGAIGWLVGEAGRGLNAMFTMMNAERLFVGIQGLGIAEIAQQKAATYAKERLQGHSADGARSPVPIIEHADVRKMLLSGRAFADAGRALAIWTAMKMDQADRDPAPAARAAATGLVALLTPVIKAAYTDLAFETAVTSQQVLGGHGYIREWRMEQYVRDVRVTQIYEGTNGVQAMDLVMRKLPMEGAGLAARFFDIIRRDLEAANATPGLAAVTTPVMQSLERLDRTTGLLLQADSDVHRLGAAATDYLRFFALVSLGWMWARMAAAARSGLERAPVERRKLPLARFFVDRILPQTLALEATISAGASAITDVETELI
jgi:alkylation response protein AidB-like acyl-CoA dehydrogenase